MFRQGARTYDISVKLAEEEGMGQVAAFPFPAAPGRAVVLADFAQVTQSRADRGGRRGRVMSLTDEGLVIRTPASKPCGHAFAFRIGRRAPWAE